MSDFILGHILQAVFHIAVFVAFLIVCAIFPPTRKAIREFVKKNAILVLILGTLFGVESTIEYFAESNQSEHQEVKPICHGLDDMAALSQIAKRIDARNQQYLERVMRKFDSR